MKFPFYPRYLSFYLPLVISLFIGGGLSILLTLIYWSSEVYKVKTNFEKQGDHLVENLQQHIQEYINITDALGAFYEASDQVTRQDFKLFTEHFLDENLGILGMAWVPKVSQKDRFLYEEEMKKAGFPNFKIWTKQGNNLRDRNEYFPVTYGEPKEIYHSVIGLELSSSEILNSPLKKARDTGEITASQPVKLINEGQGFMLYYPVYRRESYAETVEERRQEFKGIVYTVYRLEDLIKLTLHHSSSPNRSFFLSNTPTLQDNSIILSFDADTQIINTTTRLPFSIPSSCQSLLQCQRKITIADTHWFITIIPTNQQNLIIIKSVFVFLLGLLLTVLITTYLWKTLSEKNHIEQVITERTNALIKTTEELEQIVEQRTNELEKANEEKNQILDKINHELRIPLNNVLGFLDLLGSEHSLTEKKDNSLQIIQENSQYLLRLFNQILEFSKVTSGEILIQCNIVNLENLVTTVLKQFEQQAEVKKLTLSYSIDSEVFPYLKIDESKLIKILSNLLDNAIKFSNQGIITIRVFCDNQAWLLDNEIDDYTDDNFQKNLWIEIEDHGNGIPIEIQEKVFDPFFRSKDNKGVGLGLSITHKLVDLMGGKIYLKSQLGQGTIVQFHFPVTVPKPEEIYKTPTNQKIVSIANYEPDYRILVIDDQIESREVFINFLEPLGFQLKQANYLENALNIAQNWHPHLIFIDIKILFLNKKVNLKKLKNYCSLEQVIVIGIASGKFEDSQVNKLQFWCDDCLYKPFAIELILDKINYYLGVRYRYEHEENEIISTGKIVKKLNSASVAMMSSQWLEQVYWAASSGNSNVLKELIQQIPDNYSPVINGMMELVNTFNYRKIRQIIQPLID
ncbi:two-component hybrid sensor and regulator [Crocosphaera subtropica ATCC 51142]|uniref:histidine kinase n=1 Tax=Crocosphaera subtropica (strain ATCC 51142 / BH68) TaxID=43989 RepID=B1WPX0_CROS5|nr:CHASE domain-containing protein [Crocosphaera subtropica]ACB53285.1 two-component hybrid sensor and regulator [Crocosphaera subtropica ATCC 51142]